jgi:hypothetical protein
MPVLQRPFWNGDPEELRELFALAKGDRAHARCALWSHQFGWELRLTVNGSLVRSQVSRVFAEVADAAEEWQRAMREEGWRRSDEREQEHPPPRWPVTTPITGWPHPPAWGPHVTSRRGSAVAEITR